MHTLQSFCDFILLLLSVGDPSKYISFYGLRTHSEIHGKPVSSKYSEWLAPFPRGSRGGAVVRALASHKCCPGSNPGVDGICGLRLLSVLFLAPRGFIPVFPSPQKPTFSNFTSARNQVDEELLTSKSLSVYVKIFIFIYSFFVLFLSPFCAHGALTHRELYFVLKVTEMVYVHSKMMIVDDNTVIIGSGIVYKYVPCPLYTIVPRSVDGHYRLMKTCSARSKRRDHFL